MAKAAQSNLSRKATQALLTKAWNAYATGETKNLVWDGKREEMPAPLTALEPALLPPASVDNTPKLDGNVRAEPSENGKPKAGRRKKGPKLRGGLSNAAA